MTNAKPLFEDFSIGFAKDAYDAALGADLLLVLTEWNEFRELDFERVQKGMSTPVIYDTRNIYDPEKMRKYNFQYHAMGRK